MRQLYIQQKVFKILDHYAITDSQGRVHYYVDQDFRLIGHSVRVSLPDGQNLFAITREIFTFLPRFVVNFVDGRQLTIKSNFTFFRRDIDIDPDHLGLSLQGDFFDHNFAVYMGPNLIGSIHRAWLSWGDCYELRIHDERFEELFVAIVIAVDRLIDESRDNS